MGAPIEQETMELLYQFKERGFVKRVKESMKQGKGMVHEALNDIRETIEGDPRSQLLFSVRLLTSNGSLIDQAGHVISMHASSLILEINDEESYTLQLLASKPIHSGNPENISWIGLPRSGKTSLIHRLKYNEFKEVKPTPGIHIETTIFQGVMYHHFDVGGQIAFQPDLLETILLDCSPTMISLVIGGNQRDSWTHDSHFTSWVSERLPHLGIPVTVIVNPSDVHENDEMAEARRLCQECNIRNGTGTWRPITMSARTGIGIPDYLLHLEQINETASLQQG
ncbi:hypothetical protein GF325_00380 [Candidatus Bathyarchaeota archaeon]|nr:hypothetical protein [Candidatus Bathyarchaeota archaeon]